MTAASANPLQAPIPARIRTVTPPHFFADLYNFKWPLLTLELPLVSTLPVAACLFAGVLAGYPAAGLVAGGGAFTVGFGANQRISDSRLIPMLSAVVSVAAATLVGTLAGHKSSWLGLAAAASGFLYGLLTARNTGVSWVAQTATIAMLVASGYPADLSSALIRAGLLAAGGLLQLIVISTGLSLLRNLPRDALAIPASIYQTVEEQQRELVRRLRHLPKSLPALSRKRAVLYALLMTVTVAGATEVYRQLGIKSGYWVPMTALLVQKPAFYETVSRALARVTGTLAGAYLGSLLIMHLVPQPEILAAVTAVFAFLSYATIAVNYGLFSACITGYIVFLLSLNQIPGPMMAERRAGCTALGAAIAVFIHLYALRLHRAGTGHRSGTRPRKK